jgi:hypothetical protein
MAKARSLCPRTCREVKRFTEWTGCKFAETDDRRRRSVLRNEAECPVRRSRTYAEPLPSRRRSSMPAEACRCMRDAGSCSIQTTDGVDVPSRLDGEPNGCGKAVKAAPDGEGRGRRWPSSFTPLSYRHGNQVGANAMSVAAIVLVSRVIPALAQRPVRDRQTITAALPSGSITTSKSPPARAFSPVIYFWDK